MFLEKDYLPSSIARIVVDTNYPKNYLRGALVLYGKLIV